MNQQKRNEGPGKSTEMWMELWAKRREPLMMSHTNSLGRRRITCHTKRRGQGRLEGFDVDRCVGQWRQQTPSYCASWHALIHHSVFHHPGDRARSHIKSLIVHDCRPCCTLTSAMFLMDASIFFFLN